ncbi:hypothetical protein BVY04_03510 [bacterium M21]|nr:hypothetical protein BVY04_03510 [bacterium M21]
MHRPIRTDFSRMNTHDLAVEQLLHLPDKLIFDGSDFYGQQPYSVMVRAGQCVTAGECLIRHDAADLHAPSAAKVVSIEGTKLTLEPSAQDWQLSAKPPTEAEIYDDFPSFLGRIGLRGMGGSRFPASIKVKASMQADCFVLNAVECEPEVTIDQALLLHQEDLVVAGIEATVAAIGARRIVIAVRKGDKQLLEALRARFKYEFLVMPDRYPTGAEKLIVKALTGKMPPAGVLPFQFGVLVQNVASMRALGRAVSNGVPVIERPLSVISPEQNVHRNLIVPIGMQIGAVLKAAGCLQGKGQTIVAGGLMMGHEVSVDEVVDKGTTSVFLVSEAHVRGEARSCIRCGACNNGCPLGLHPIGMVERLANEQLGRPLRAQLAECFLCGVCSSVCPSNIPLVEQLREGKKCL